jgi:hypothetical protein
MHQTITTAKEDIQLEDEMGRFTWTQDSHDPPGLPIWIIPSQFQNVDLNPLR